MTNKAKVGDNTHCYAISYAPWTHCSGPKDCTCKCLGCGLAKRVEEVGRRVGQ